MISDVLFETVDAIRYYQREMPDVYKDLKPRLDRLVSEMEAMRVELDTPPTN